MNTSGASQNEAISTFRDDAAPEPPRRTREAEDLLAAIAAALQQQGPPAARLPSPEPSAGDAPERWRQSGGALTGTTTHIDPPGVSGTELGSESRLVAQIETQGLGRVCVIIDRSESGMKVFLAMDDAGAVGQALAERGALVQALEAAGLTVASVSVTRFVEGGITFAQVRDAHEAQASEGSESSDAPDGQSDIRTRRRLDLVG